MLRGLSCIGAAGEVGGVPPKSRNVAELLAESARGVVGVPLEGEGTGCACDWEDDADSEEIGERLLWTGGRGKCEGGDGNEPREAMEFTDWLRSRMSSALSAGVVAGWASYEFICGEKYVGGDVAPGDGTLETYSGAGVRSAGSSAFSCLSSWSVALYSGSDCGMDPVQFPVKYPFSVSTYRKGTDWRRTFA